MRRYIAIDLLTAKECKISLTDWALLENIHFMSNNPSGWCYASKETLADIVIVSRPTIYRMLDKLEDRQFIEREFETGNLKVTNKWENIMNGVSFNKNNAQSQNDTTTKNSSIKMRQPQYQNETNVVSKRYLKEDIKEENKRELRSLDFLKEKDVIFYESFLMKNKKQILNFEKFVEDFNDKVDIEGLEYTTKILSARLNTFTRNWIVNQNKYQNTNNDAAIVLHPALKRIG